MSNEFREQLADVQHGIWAHWMNYLFSCCQYNEDGTAVIPADKVERWMRQQGTSYADLTDKERESDRHQADKVIALFTGTITALRQRTEAASAEQLDRWRAEVEIIKNANVYSDGFLKYSVRAWREMIPALLAEVESLRAEFDAATASAVAAETALAALPPEAPDTRIAPLSEWMQAIGLLTTLCPTLEMDSSDPLGMAKQIEAYVLAQASKTQAAEAKLALVDDYGLDQWGNGREHGPQQYFDDWLKAQHQAAQP